MNPAATINAGQAIVDAMREEGVDTVFGMPGGHVIDIYDALEHTPEIRTILVRHEQLAACMAGGYAQLTGRPAVVVVTAGPGATNLLTAVAESYVGSLPMVVIAGRGSTATSHRGASQEVSTERMFAPVTKMAVRVDRADLLVDHVRRAFTIARNGKPGPVYIDIPKDLLTQDVPARRYYPAGAPARTAASAASVEAAARALASAERPLIIAGGGVTASGAFTQLRTIAEAGGIPVLTSLAGRGSLPDDHPLAAGGLGAHRTHISRSLLQQADVILGLGTRFEEMETNYRPDFLPSPQACYIQVDIDPQEAGRGVIPQISVVGDIGAVLDQLLETLHAMRAFTDVGDFRRLPRVRTLLADVEKLNREIETLADDDRTPISPLRVLRTARKVFPRETSVALDVGKLAQHMGGAFPYFRVYEPRSLIVPSSFYGMGFASGAAPAAKLVYPDRPALCFVGDGSFQMIMNVLATAAEQRLGVTWCVLNDRAIGSIRDIQVYSKGNRVFATEFKVQPDFALVARASDCYGERVEKPSEVDSALRRALEANQRGVPAVLDFQVTPQRLESTRDHYGWYPKDAGNGAPAGGL